MRTMLRLFGPCAMALFLGCATSGDRAERDHVKWTVWNAGFSRPAFCHDVFRDNTFVAYRVNRDDPREPIPLDPARATRLWLLADDVLSSFPGGDYADDFDGECFTIEIVRGKTQKTYRIGNLPAAPPAPARLQSLWGALSGLTAW